MKKSETFLIEQERCPEKSEMSEFDSPFRTVNHRACIVKDGKILEWYENKGIIKGLIENKKPKKSKTIPNYTGANDYVDVYVLSSKDLSTLEKYADKNLIKSITEGCQLQILVREYITKWWNE